MAEGFGNSYSIDTGELFYNVEDIPEEPETIKAYIPKLMVNIDLGEGPVTNIKWTCSPSMFVNSPECRVNGVKSVVSGQNFITLHHHNNEHPNFHDKAELVDGKYVVRKHNKFSLEIHNDDIDNMHFTGKD